MVAPSSFQFFTILLYVYFIMFYKLTPNSLSAVISVFACYYSKSPRRLFFLVVFELYVVLVQTLLILCLSFMRIYRKVGNLDFVKLLFVLAFPFGVLEFRLLEVKMGWIKRRGSYWAIWFCRVLFLCVEGGEWKSRGS